MKFNFTIKRMLFYVALVAVFFAVAGVPQFEGLKDSNVPTLSGRGLLANYQFRYWKNNDGLLTSSFTVNRVDVSWFTVSAHFYPLKIRLGQLFGVIGCVAFVIIGFWITRIPKE